MNTKQRLSDMGHEGRNADTSNLDRKSLLGTLIVKFVFSPYLQCW